MRPDWLNNIPTHWTCVPFGSIFQQIKRKNSKLERDFVLSVVKNRGVVPYSKKGNIGNKVSEDLSGYKLVNKGDFVLNSMNLYMGSVGVSEFDGVTSSAYIVCRPKENICSDYYNYLIQFKGFQEYVGLLGKGIMEIREAVRWTSLKSVFIPLPDFNNQRLIAKFLKDEISLIDSLLEKKDHLVRLLKKRQELFIEEQLNSVDASLNYRLKFVINGIEQGWSPQCHDTRVDGENWGVLKLGAITKGTYIENEHKSLPDTLNPRPSLRVNAGDVLVARASGSPKLVGKAVYVEKVNLNLMMSDKHFRLVPNAMKVRPEYLALVVNSMKCRNQIEDRLSSAEGMARNIPQKVIYDLRCPFPSLQDQDQILNTVHSLQEKMDILVSKTNISINLLNEYRSSMITAAVTGQIDVSNYSGSFTSKGKLNAIKMKED